MASQLPLDFGHPAVREYVNLIRLQVLTPLSTLVSIAAVLATELIVHPSLSEIIGIWPTSISPRTSLVAFYLLVLFGGQVGRFLYDVYYWLYLTFELDRLLLTTGTSLVSIEGTRDACTLPEYFCLPQERTNQSAYQIRFPSHQAPSDLDALYFQKAMVHGVGFPVILANWLMASWAVAFSFQAFTACSVLIGIIVILLAFVNLRVMLYHPAAWTSPIDYLLLHAPVVSRAQGVSCVHLLIYTQRLFLLVTMTLMLPLSIFLAIGHRWSKGHEEAYDHYQWEGFSVVLSTGLLGTIVAAWRSDLVWSMGTVWLLWCIGASHPKPAPVSVCGVCLTPVPSYTKAIFRVLLLPSR